MKRIGVIALSLVFVVALTGVCFPGITTKLLNLIPACPEPDRVVILQTNPPKSLLQWWDDSAYTGENASEFWKPVPRPRNVPTAYYFERQSPERLIGRRGVMRPQLLWGPMAEDGKYTVLWRGVFDVPEIHVRLDDCTEEEARLDLARHEGRPVVIITTSSSARPASPSTAP